MSTMTSTTRPSEQACKPKRKAVADQVSLLWLKWHAMPSVSTSTHLHVYRPLARRQAAAYTPTTPPAVAHKCPLAMAVAPTVEL